MCQGTTYCNSRASFVDTSDQEHSCWWLRSSGNSSHTAAIVLSSGHIEAFGRNTNYCFAVRPVMWISLE